MLDPRSDAARDIATLWWWMLGVAGVFLLGAVGLLGLSWLLRHREGVPIAGRSTRFELGSVVVFGLGIPAVVLIALFAVANLVVLPGTDAPARATTRMTVEVVGAQWFWRVTYPGTTAVTANEIHIPARTRVDVVARTADVIHSFWVPQLNRKIDMVPGRANRVLLYADRPGRYRGQCAEFCGVQHSHMGLTVVAEPPERFRAWLAAQGRARTSPATALERRGEQVFMDSACASCHTIRGTPAAGEVGPDLTHVGARSTLAARTLANTPAGLARWISDPQHVKPGNRMPDLGLDRSRVDALVAYLESLR